MTTSPAVAVRRWAFAPVDTAPMAALRIACGLLVVGWTVSLLPDVQAFLAEDGLTASGVHGTRGWWSVDLVSPWAAVALLLLAAVALLVGWHTRVAAIAVTVLLIAIQRRDVYMLNSGDLLLRHLALYVALMPAGEVWSLDARRRGMSAPRAPWGLRLLQVQVSLLYFFSVVAKLHGDTWQDGTAVGRAVQLADLQRFLVPESVATSVTASALLTYGTLVIEGALVFGLWLPRFRWWVMAAGLSIHLGIEATLLIGWFSLTVISCYLAFVPPEVLRRAVAAVLSRVRRDAPAPAPAPVAALPPAEPLEEPVVPRPVSTEPPPVVPASAASSYWLGPLGQQQGDQPGQRVEVGLPAREDVGVDEGLREPDDGVGDLVERQPEGERVDVVDEQPGAGGDDREAPRPPPGAPGSP